MFGKYVIETGRDSHPSLNFRCVVWDISTGETLHITEWHRQPVFPRKEAVKWCCEQMVIMFEQNNNLPKGWFVEQCKSKEYRDHAANKIATMIGMETLQTILANQ